MLFSLLYGRVAHLHESKRAHNFLFNGDIELKTMEPSVSDTTVLVRTYIFCAGKVYLFFNTLFVAAEHLFVDSKVQEDMRRQRAEAFVSEISLLIRSFVWTCMANASPQQKRTGDEISGGK